MSDYIYHKKSVDFEKVVIDEWLPGHISGVEIRKDQKTIFEGVEKIVDQIRYELTIPGYKYKKYTRWFKISLHEKSGLFALLKKLIPDLAPETDGIALDGIKGMGIKVMFDDYAGKDGKVWQTITNIKPLDKVSYKDITKVIETPADFPETLSNDAKELFNAEDELPC